VDYSSLNDETLIRLIVRKQPDAMNELYNRYNRLVFSLAFNVVGDQATAEEIALDVFIRIWEKANTYRADKAKVNTWLTSITRYHSIDILRRKGSRPEQYNLRLDDVSPNAAPNSSNPEESTQLSMQRERVRSAVAQLPEEQQQALALAYFKGYTHRQIAKLLDQPLGTVKTRIRLAMRKLREILQDE
jgi:RNA polymerase sigma-70 factor (ECF subfamily)